jgi:hypothetical protein
VPTDRYTETLLDALKQALAGGEHRLFRAGKLPGLFPGRTGVSAEAATAAVRDGLLEVARTETKNKTVIEWVRLAPRGVDFLHDHESPVRALHELRDTLRTAKAGVPEWVAQMRQALAQLGDRLKEDSHRFQLKLEALSTRVDEALRRLEARGPELPTNLVTAAPWAADALAYLDRRRGTGASGECALPELYAALAEKHGDLSLIDFQDGLRRLQRERVLHLKPFTGAPADLPQPEYAIFDHGTLLYYAAR